MIVGDVIDAVKVLTGNRETLPIGVRTFIDLDPTTTFHGGRWRILSGTSITATWSNGRPAPSAAAISLPAPRRSATRARLASADRSGWWRPDGSSTCHGGPLFRAADPPARPSGVVTSTMLLVILSSGLYLLCRRLDWL